LYATQQPYRPVELQETENLRFTALKIGRAFGLKNKCSLSTEILKVPTKAILFKRAVLAAYKWDLYSKPNL